MSRLDRAHPPAPLAATPVAQPAPSLPRRLLLWSTLALAATLGLLAGAAPLPADPELTALLRFMAATKAGIALGAALLVDWRLRHPIRPALAAAAITASATALAGPALMFGLVQMTLGGVLHYAGLGALLLLAALDRAAIGAILREAVSRRRR
jgi:hypothetical protein